MPNTPAQDPTTANRGLVIACPATTNGLHLRNRSDHVPDTCLFFERLGSAAAVDLLVLAAASVFVQGAWCRFLCPYGALLGLFSWMSPVKIR
jgi:hypothetical protein